MAALILVRPHAVQAYFSDHTPPVGVVVPPEAVRDLEVLDEEMLSRTIAGALKKPPTVSASAAIVVLTDELCFTRDWKEKAEIDLAVKDLNAQTPFAHVATAIVKLADRQFVAATNQDLYEALVRSISAAGFSVTGVVTWAALVGNSITQHGEIDPVTVRRAHDAIAILRDGAFPLPAIKSEPEKSPEPVRTAPKRGLSKGLLIFLICAALYAAVMLFVLLRPQ